jgi:muramoyltetrapeptide carboxypeptidase
VALVAPAGPVPREGFEAGRARLAERYHLAYDEALFTADGYLAGSDARRAEELNNALRDPTVRAIFVARGGYGLTRILPSLELGHLPRRPKLVIGFSDVTALHAACLRAGVVSLHGPTLTHLGAIGPEYTGELLARLESAAAAPPWVGLETIAAGHATGVAVGGNLEICSRLCGTPWALPLDGAVLFLEDVGERPYRVDRSLTQLEMAGAAKVAAVVVGDLTRCQEPSGQGPTVEEVVRERLSRWRVPVVANAPFGHGERNSPFALGAPVSVDGSAGSVTFLEGAVV